MFYGVVLNRSINNPGKLQMKKFIILLVAAFGMTQALADAARFVNGDGSALTNMCIDAIETDDSFRKLAKFYGFEDMAESDLVCNGLSLSRFKIRYANSEEVNTVLSFSKSDLSPTTELCFAAVTGADNLESLKESYNSKTNSDVEKVTCNGMPLDRFVRRYAADAFASND